MHHFNDHIRRNFSERFLCHNLPFSQVHTLLPTRGYLNSWILYFFMNLILSSGYSSGTSTLLVSNKQNRTYRIDLIPKWRRNGKFRFTGNAPILSNGLFISTSIQPLFDDSKVRWWNELVIYGEIFVISCVFSHYSENAESFKTSKSEVFCGMTIFSAPLFGIFIVSFQQTQIKYT